MNCKGEDSGDLVPSSLGIHEELGMLCVLAIGESRGCEELPLRIWNLSAQALIKRLEGQGGWQQDIG